MVVGLNRDAESRNVSWAFSSFAVCGVSTISDTEACTS